MEVPTLVEKVLRSSTENSIANLSNKKAPKPHPWVTKGKYFFPLSVSLHKKKQTAFLFPKSPQIVISSVAASITNYFCELVLEKP